VPVLLIAFLWTVPAWGQSAVWQPQGATTGNIYYIGNGGNVGIGTASPAHTLHISGSLEADYGGDNMVLLNVGGQNVSKSGLAIGYGLTYNGVSMANAGFCRPRPGERHIEHCCRIHSLATWGSGRQVRRELYMFTT
jgi:hypothetical protein